MLAYSAGPFVSVNSFLFYARGLGFITGFEEPDSALLPPSGSFWSSSSPWRPQLEVRNKVGF